MRIMKLTPDVYEPMQATLTKRKQHENNLQYTIMHGSLPRRRMGTWGVKMYLSKRAFPVTDGKPGNKITLDKHNYFILPMRDKDGKNMVDKQGKVIYMITLSNDITSLVNHDLVFWHIPVVSGEMKIEYKGAVREIMRGMFGTENLDRVYKSPAPVLDISGDCKLIYKYTEDGVTYECVYEYDSKENKWTRSTNRL